jgi:hypothetical protein
MTSLDCYHLLIQINLGMGYKKLPIYLIPSVKSKLVSFDDKKIKGVSPKSRGNNSLDILSAWVINNQESKDRPKIIYKNSLAQKELGINFTPREVPLNRFLE